MVKFTLRIDDDELVNEFDGLAKAHGLTRTAVLALREPEILGVAAVVPAATLPERAPTGTDMQRDDEVEAAAMARATSYEEQRGWTVEDVSAEGRGYDLVSRSPAGDLRYIEVKGRAGIGGVELSENEWLKAEQLGADYWLYIVADARNTAQLYLVQDPGHRLPREEVVPRVRYRVTRQGWDKVAERVVEYEA